MPKQVVVPKQASPNAPAAPPTQLHGGSAWATCRGQSHAAHTPRRWARAIAHATPNSIVFPFENVVKEGTMMKRKEGTKQQS